MPRIKIIPALLPVLLAICLAAAAQLSPSQPDPLARIREGGTGQYSGVLGDGGIAVRAGRSEDHRQCAG